MRKEATDYQFFNRGWFEPLPWAKASCTSPPTPVRESCGVWAGVELADADLIGIGIGRLIVWLGDERGEPAPWV